MKRGLVLFEPHEIPADEVWGRISRLQQSLKQQGISVAFIYGDVYHSADLTYLSNICIYWNEAVLAVPATGNPALLTKLSSRVHTWMRSISVLDDLRSGPSLEKLIKEYLKDAEPGAAGLVEMDWWPAQIVDRLRQELTGWQIQDLGAIVRQQRQYPSESEEKLLRESAKISAKAVAAGFSHDLTNAERAGKAELTARMAGVEDVYVFCTPATEQADVIEVLSEYRGYWTTAARIVLKGSADWAPLMQRAYEAAANRLRSGVSQKELVKAIEPVLAGADVRWRVDLIHHMDLETNGEYRLPGEENHSFHTGAVAALRLEFTMPDGSHAVAADTYQIDDAGAVCLTAGLPSVFFN
jgi:hypothetical protein